MNHESRNPDHVQEHDFKEGNIILLIFFGKRKAENQALCLSFIALTLFLN